MMKNYDLPRDVVYPSFNDAPHERPILTDVGLGRALLVLGSLLTGITGLAFLLLLL